MKSNAALKKSIVKTKDFKTALQFTVASVKQKVGANPLAISFKKSVDGTIQVRLGVLAHSKMIYGVGLANNYSSAIKMAGKELVKNFRDKKNAWVKKGERGTAKVRKLKEASANLKILEDGFFEGDFGKNYTFR